MILSQPLVDLHPQLDFKDNGYSVMSIQAYLGIIREVGISRVQSLPVHIYPLLTYHHLSKIFSLELVQRFK